MLFFIIWNPQIQGLLMLEKDLNKKRSKGIFVRENLKKSIVIKNVIWFDDTLKQSVLAIILSNTFTHNQAEQIKKGVIS